MRDGRNNFYRQLNLDKETWKAVNFFRQLRLALLQNPEIKKANKNDEKKDV